jgi:hypothetical protein
VGQLEKETSMTKRIEIEYELKAEDDDDIQDYKRPWVGLTQEELCEIVGVSTNDSDWNVFKVQEWLRKVEAKLKEKNT